MRTTSIAIIVYMIMCCFSCTKNSDEVTVSSVDIFTKIFPEDVAFKKTNDTVEVAAGEHAVFQFAIRSPFNLTNTTLSCEAFRDDDGNTIDSIQTGFVKYVGVGTPTDQRPHDALTSTTGLYPDAIVPEKNLLIEGGRTQPAWITVTTSGETKPGLYQTTLKIQGEERGYHFLKEEKMFIRVYPVKLVKPAFYNLNWFFDAPDKLKIFNNGQEADMFSETYWKLMEAIAGKMCEIHQNVAMVNPLTHIKFIKTGDKYGFDFTNFDKVLDIFIHAGVADMIVGSQLGDRAESDGWTANYVMKLPEEENGQTIIRYYPLEDPMVQNFYKQFIPALMGHLKDKKLDRIYYQHIADEPIDSNADSYIAIAKFIKSIAPEVKFIEACQSSKLTEALDVWIPILPSFQNQYEFFNDLLNKGTQVWFYICLYPRGEYVNRLIEWPLIKTRLIYWLAFKYRATGFLHWGFNYWTEHPYEETTVVDSYGTILPAGDSFIVYPDYNGGLNRSIRFEAMRDGMEDYALLKMLEKKNAQLANQICKTVVLDWNKYSTDACHFRQIRHQILEELSK
ncbi:MAG: DUF4091 domain-containing protein [Prolixibacteraceae bacterium]